MRDFPPVTPPVRSPIRSSTPLRRSRLPPSRGGAESRCAYLPQQPPFHFPATSLVGGDLSSPSTLAVGSVTPICSRCWAPHSLLSLGSVRGASSAPRATLRGSVGEALVDVSALKVCPMCWRRGEEIPETGAIDPRRTSLTRVAPPDDEEKEEGHKGHFTPQVAIIIKIAKHI